MRKIKTIPQPLKEALDKVAKDYSESNATTNAGRVLRFFAKFVSYDTVVKLFAHKSRK